MKVISGIDLAGKPENPTGWAVWKGKTVKAGLTYTDDQILECTTHDEPEIIAIDAPFSLPKSGILRRADKEMLKRGFRVFPPNLPAMRKLTTRAIGLNKLLTEMGYRTIEVHPTSTRKALNIPPKDWSKIQTVLAQIGFGGDLKSRSLTPHEMDAVTAALTGHLYMKNQTEALGDEEEGFIIVPKKQDWRTIRV